MSAHGAAARVSRPVGLAPVLTPRGHLILTRADDGPSVPAEQARRIEAAFERGSGPGLLQLGAGEVGTPLPAELGYWRDFAARFVTAVCTHPEIEEFRKAARLASPPDLDALAASVPPMTGAEYLTPAVLRALWEGMESAFRAERAESGTSAQELLARYSPSWHVVGRVHFNLAENRDDEQAPFGFLATYTARLSAHGKVQHSPLGVALREYSGEAKRERLLALLLPVQRAAESCAWLRALVESGEIFFPLRWSAAEAFQLLQDVERLEAAGVVVRVPRAWRSGRPPRPLVTATVGTKPAAGLGADALLDFRMEVTLGGERLTAEEIERLLAGSDGLALIRGQWITVDRAKLSEMLERFSAVEREAAASGMAFAEAMRLLALADVSGAAEAAPPDPEWSQVVAGPWLADTLRRLRAHDGLSADPGGAFHGSLRPYQRIGVGWLRLLAQLGLGACLADDMGLGKTIQVLSLLLVLKRDARGQASGPSLLVAPASLLGNWAAEIERFAPSLEFLTVHPSATGGEPREAPLERLGGLDLVITTYGSLRRLPWLAETSWNLAVLDEAQAIKNPAAQQTKAAKRLKARGRIALTGTPVENRLSDLWSIFDFVNPGLLGSAREFSAFAKRLSERPVKPYEPLRELVRPYILRRLKTDSSVIADLPAKTEVKAYCALSRRQAALYQQAVDELAEKLARVDEGIKRKGLVLSFLTRFKQICNHPSHWLRDGTWAEVDSGKLARLRELAEVIAARQEKLLVFTQFREVTGPLSEHLAAMFGRGGLVLHGETDVAKRRALVERFQQDETVPYFVLSLKAGGVGLNLTAASHVVHFDRWWNPAVEDQATDRTFRIGQTRNVLVHKFVCRGTVEDKIDQLIDAKQKLSRDLLEGGAELLLTEMEDEQLLKLVKLDLKSATAES